MSAPSVGVRVTLGRLGTRSSQRSRSSGWARRLLNVPPCGGGPGRRASGRWACSTLAATCAPPASRRGVSGLVTSALPGRAVGPDRAALPLTLARLIDFYTGGIQLSGLALRTKSGIGGYGGVNWLTVWCAGESCPT